MKLYHFVFAVLVLWSFVCHVESLPQSFLKLFGAEDYYYPQFQPRLRSYGRQYGNSEGGNRRYKAICRIHAVDSLAFPGRVGNPVCPY